jgi:uncharacterized protein YbjT (DUF2867 family)
LIAQGVDHKKTKATLVLGGTGKTGRRVSKRLTASGLGREPRDFTDYARAAAAAGVWDDR